jgi:hypothetical protein
MATPTLESDAGVGVGRKHHLHVRDRRPPESHAGYPAPCGSANHAALF